MGSFGGYQQPGGMQNYQQQAQMQGQNPQQQAPRIIPNMPPGGLQRVGLQANVNPNGSLTPEQVQMYKQAQANQLAQVRGLPQPSAQIQPQFQQPQPMYHTPERMPLPEMPDYSQYRGRLGHRGGGMRHMGRRLRRMRRRTMRYGGRQ